jgi:hypothetical protein
MSNFSDIDISVMELSPNSLIESKVVKLGVDLFLKNN